MKASDSVNSLTELNSSEQSNPSCFICLGEDLEQGEPLVSSKLLRNCGCKFSVHPACWNVWIKEKSDYDCPICQKASMKRIHIPPNPVLVMEYREEHYSCVGKWRLPLCILATGATGFLIASIILWG